MRLPSFTRLDPLGSMEILSGTMIDFRRAKRPVLGCLSSGAESVAKRWSRALRHISRMTGALQSCCLSHSLRDGVIRRYLPVLRA